MPFVNEVESFISVNLQHNARRQELIPREIREAETEISDPSERRAKIVELKSESARLRLHTARLEGYKPAPNGDLVCPDCLMRMGQEHALYAVPDSVLGRRVDAFRCHVCRETYAIGDEA